LWLRNGHLGSLSLDSGRPDDRPPFLDFCPLQCAKCLGRLLVAEKISNPSLASRIRTVGSAKGSGIEGTQQWTAYQI
jgi:hypothetical protein